MRQLRLRIINRFERALLSGSFSAVAMLFIGTTFLIFVGSLFVRLLGIHATRDDLSFVDSMWEILQRAIDPGQLANENAWSSRLTLLIVTIFGLLLVSTLISIVNSTLERRIEDVRRGRRPVNFSDHVVLIGWNDAASKLIEELAIARIEGVDLQLVVFTENDPIELLNHISDHIQQEDEIDQMTDVARRVSSWVTVRRARGDRTNDLIDLGRIDKAKALICLLEDGNDYRNTRVVLAALAALQLGTVVRRPLDVPLNVVVQFNSEHFAQKFKRRIDSVVEYRQKDAGGLLELHTVTPELVRNKVEVNVARSRGLSAVYKDLLDLAGDELYLVRPNDPDLKFGAMRPAAGCIPLGFARGVDVDLWPKWEESVGSREVVVLAGSMAIAKSYIENLRDEAPLPVSRRTGRLSSGLAEHFLFIGQNNWLYGLIDQLEKVVPRGSTAALLVKEGEEVVELPSFASSSLEIIRRSADSEPLDDPLFISRFDHVVVMADMSVGDEESDARVLTDVLACRVHVDSKDSSLPLTVVAELRRRASKHIAAVRMADDLLVSDALTACALAQFALYPENGEVLRYLLGTETSVVLQCVSVQPFLEDQTNLRWGDLIERIRLMTGEIAIAIRKNQGRVGNPDVVMNPTDELIVSDEDEVVVLTQLSPHS